MSEGFFRKYFRKATRGRRWGSEVVESSRECSSRAADEKRATEDAKILEDVPDLTAPPADETWDAEKEVAVAGSSTLGCKTKVVESWF